MDGSLQWLQMCMDACMLVCSFVWLNVSVYIYFYIQYMCVSVLVCLCKVMYEWHVSRASELNPKYVCLIERAHDIAWPHPEMPQDKFNKWMCAVLMTHTLNQRHVMEKAPSYLKFCRNLSTKGFTDIGGKEIFIYHYLKLHCNLHKSDSCFLAILVVWRKITQL